jgi:carbon storage regulator
MLVWDRKKYQGIVINDNIIVTVLEIRGDKVRLCIENALSVRREEKLTVRQQAEQEAKNPSRGGNCEGPGA